MSRMVPRILSLGVGFCFLAAALYNYNGLTILYIHIYIYIYNIPTHLQNSEGFSDLKSFTLVQCMSYHVCLSQTGIGSDESYAPPRFSFLEFSCNAAKCAVLSP